MGKELVLYDEPWRLQFLRASRNRKNIQIAVSRDSSASWGQDS